MGLAAAPPLPLPAGEIVTVPPVLAEPVIVRFGGVRAEVQWAELSGTGLNQLNVVVPDLPNGDVEVVAEMGGVATGPGDFVPIQR